MSAWPYSTTLRSGSFAGSKAVSGITSTDPLPRYQNCSASNRAFASAHAASSAVPFVPYTNTTRCRKASLNGPSRCGPFSAADGRPDAAHFSPVRVNQTRAPSAGQGTAANDWPSSVTDTGLPGGRWPRSSDSRATFSVDPANVRFAGSCRRSTWLTTNGFTWASTVTQ